MRNKYKIYKELNQLFQQETNDAKVNFWRRCKDAGIKGFAVWMCILPVLIIYGLYFGCIYGPVLIEKIKTKKAINQSLESCTPEEEVEWGEEDFAE